MKITHVIQSCIVFLSGFLVVDCAVAQMWPIQLEGTATVRNVLFESFLRPT